MPLREESEEKIEEERQPDLEDKSTSEESESEDEDEPKRKTVLPLNQRKSFIVPTKTLWPADVRSHMKVLDWIALMEEVGLHEDIPYIANGFREGFCLGIPQHELEGMK